MISTRSKSSLVTEFLFIYLVSMLSEPVRLTGAHLVVSPTYAPAARTKASCPFTNVMNNGTLQFTGFQRTSEEIMPE